MARTNIEATRGKLRQLRAFEKQYIGLRAKAARLHREELALWRNLDRFLSGKRGHIMTLEHKPGRKDRVTHDRGSAPRSLVAMARARGSSGLFCGCQPIRIQPQPNDDIDICILIDCSNDPATSGFRCHYWCVTLKAEPVVAIARRRTRTARKLRGSPTRRGRKW